MSQEVVGRLQAVRPDEGHKATADGLQAPRRRRQRRVSSRFLFPPSETLGANDTPCTNHTFESAPGFVRVISFVHVMISHKTLEMVSGRLAHSALILWASGGVQVWASEAFNDAEAISVQTILRTQMEVNARLDICSKAPIPTCHFP